MKKVILTVLAVLGISLSTGKLFAQAAATTPTGDLLTTLSANSDYNVMAAALRAANLGATVKGPGPYTIFAPNNTAFSNIPSDKLDALMKDPAALATVLKGHIVMGKNDKAAILAALRATGSDPLKTIDGQTLTLGVNETKNLVITDSQGNKAKVVAFDILGTNGVIIGLDGLLTK
ncbi:MAG TPA: fasciclin domain-containing protein [Mucilaginibacter sp.]|jgi:uncharacterized surface protein with fasciclin (FAS1) repeats